MNAGVSWKTSPVERRAVGDVRCRMFIGDEVADLGLENQQNAVSFTIPILVMAYNSRRVAPYTAPRWVVERVARDCRDRG